MIKGNVTGILDTIRHLNRISRSLEDKAHEFVNRLADEGFQIANSGFINAIYAGDNDVNVKLEWVDKTTLNLIAEGKAVLFIEFGSGTYYEKYPKKNVEGIDKRGTFGKKRGANPPWVYVGDPGNNGIELYHKPEGTVVATLGNPPARAMFDAEQTMKKKVREIAKEVFRND